MSEVKNQVREDLEEVLRCAEYTRTPQLSTGDEYNRLYELRTIVVNRVTRVLAALSAEGVGDAEFEAIRERHKLASVDDGYDWHVMHGLAAHTDRATLLRKVDELTRAAKET
jgi:hypothetical protein